MKRVLEEATEHDSQYFPGYFAALEYYSPMWHGNDAKIEEFISASAEAQPRVEKDVLYLRMYWYAADRFFDWYAPVSIVSCSKMMNGIDTLSRQYPDPWNLNRFAAFAVSCNDKQRARALFQRVGNQPELSAWKGSKELFTQFRI